MQLARGERERERETRREREKRTKQTRNKRLNNVLKRQLDEEEDGEDKPGGKGRSGEEDGGTTGSRTPKPKAASGGSQGGVDKRGLFENENSLHCHMR